MTATNYEGYLAEQTALVAVYNGATFVTKLSKIFSVQATYNEEVTVALPAGYVDVTGVTAINQAVIGTSISGRTITFHTEAPTTHNAYVIVKGRL